MKDSTFRKILWINVALNVAAIIAAFFPTYSAELFAAYDNEPLPWLMSTPWLGTSVLTAWALAWVGSLIGLFLFKSWARPLALYTTAFGLILTPFLGASLSSGIEGALFEAAGIVWGAILALAYFSPICDRFSANNSFKPTPLRGAA